MDSFVQGKMAKTFCLFEVRPPMLEEGMEGAPCLWP